MKGTSTEKAVINIAATCREHAAIVPHMLAALALSGCDTVAKLSDIGKATIGEKLKDGHALDKLGEKGKYKWCDYRSYKVGWDMLWQN